MLHGEQSLGLSQGHILYCVFCGESERVRKRDRERGKKRKRERELRPRKSPTASSIPQCAAGTGTDLKVSYFSSTLRIGFRLAPGKLIKH